ncbi:MAG: hypothetical protein LLG00_00770 [Planctomycetaceae bacterium]|nr:hypothetical protein [Planctomycetaceae bacterium]
MSRRLCVIRLAVAASLMAGGWSTGAAWATPEACKPVRVCGPAETAPVCSPAKHPQRVKVVKPVRIAERVEVCKPAKPVSERVEVCKPAKQHQPVHACSAVDSHRKVAVVRERFALLLKSPVRLAVEHRERHGHETAYAAPSQTAPSSEPKPSPTAAPQRAELPPAPLPSKG